jgi:hypothetical protein
MKMWRMRRRKRKEEKTQPENRIFQRKFVHIHEVMQFAIVPHSFSLLELYIRVKDCIKKDMNTKNWNQVSLLNLWKESQ